MLPEEIIEQMSNGGFSAPQLVCVTKMLFACSDAARAEMRDQMVQMHQSFGRMIIEAVKETEEKIFARMAQEAADAEEKKRLRREAIAARKAEREKAKAEGVAAAPEVRFCEENAPSKRNNDSNAAEAISSPNHAIEKSADMSDEVKVGNDADNSPEEEGFWEMSEEELEALQRENERVAGAKVGDIWKDGSKVIFVGTGGYVMTERDEYIDLAKYHAHTNTYLLSIEDLNREHLDLDTGEYKDPKMNEHIIADMAEEIAQQAARKASLQAARQWDIDHGIENNGIANPPVQGGVMFRE